MAGVLGLKPGVRVHGSCKASCRGLTAAFQRLSTGPTASSRQPLVVEGEGFLATGLPPAGCKLTELFLEKSVVPPHMQSSSESRTGCEGLRPAQRTCQDPL